MITVRYNRGDLESGSLWSGDYVRVPILSANSCSLYPIIAQILGAVMDETAAADTKQ